MCALRFGKADAVLLLLGERAQCGRDVRSALLDGSSEETLRHRRCNQRVSVRGAGRLSGDCYPRRIAAKSRDVVAHPLQSRHLVENSVVARSVGFLGQRRMGEEAEYPEPV